MHTEIIAKIQQVLNEFILEITEENTLERSNIDRLVILEQAVPDEQLDQKFHDLLEHLSANRGKLDGTQTCNILKSLAALLETQLFVDDVKARTGSNPELISFFSPNHEDRKKIVAKCSELRSIINASKAIDEKFRNRLLRRLSAIELEINKEKGLFDVLLAGTSDAGETLGKFGNDVKPIVDRFKEIVSIGRRTAGEYEELPAPDEIKKLPAPDENNES